MFDATRDVDGGAASAKGYASRPKTANIPWSRAANAFHKRSNAFPPPTSPSTSSTSFAIACDMLQERPGFHSSASKVWRNIAAELNASEYASEFRDEVRAPARANPISVDRLLDAQPAQLEDRQTCSPRRVQEMVRGW